MNEDTTEYLDGFVFAIHRKYLAEYKRVAQQVAAIWKEHGALSYSEFVGDEMSLTGTRSFMDMADVQDDEVVIIGWASFQSKEVRDSANQKVRKDPRMAQLVAPLMNPERMIFDASRMFFGGFRALVQS